MYVYMYVCKYVCMYMYMRACMYVYIYICIYLYMCVCVYVCMYIYMCVCVYVCMYICVCVCVLFVVCMCVLVRRYRQFVRMLQFRNFGKMCRHQNTAVTVCTTLCHIPYLDTLLTQVHIASRPVVLIQCYSNASHSAQCLQSTAQ